MQQSPRAVRPRSRITTSLVCTAGRTRSRKTASRVGFSSNVYQNDVSQQIFVFLLNTLMRTPITRSNIPMQRVKHRRSMTAIRAFSSSDFSGGGANRRLAGVSPTSVSSSAGGYSRCQLYGICYKSRVGTHHLLINTDTNISHGLDVLDH